MNDQFPVAQRSRSIYGEYERIIQPIERQMMQAVWRITHNADDADDAYQEATMQIWRGLSRIREHRNPQALILKICANVACDVLRRKLRHSVSGLPHDSVQVGPNVPEVSLLIEREETRNQIQTAIASLSEQQATAVTMRFLMSCEYSVIAQALDCAEATVRVHISRGLNRLRELLAGLDRSEQMEKSND